MKHLNVRTTLIYMALGAVAAEMLLFVLGGLVNMGNFGFTLVLTASRIAPLVILMALFALIFGASSKPGNSTASHKTKQILGALALAGITVAIGATYISATVRSIHFTTTQFVFENTGIAALFASYMFTLILMNTQRFIYWPFWSATDRKLTDERERTVRNRVFEKSYRIMIILGIAGLNLARLHSQRMDHQLVFTAILCVFGLPSIIASWQKDS